MDIRKSPEIELDDARWICVLSFWVLPIGVGIHIWPTININGKSPEYYLVGHWLKTHRIWIGIFGFESAVASAKLSYSFALFRLLVIIRLLPNFFLLTEIVLIRTNMCNEHRLSIRYSIFFQWIFPLFLLPPPNPNHLVHHFILLALFPGWLYHRCLRWCTTCENLIQQKRFGTHSNGWTASSIFG